jgi:ABC-type Fe3+ transport system substrate-binding protein
MLGGKMSNAPRIGRRLLLGATAGMPLLGASGIRAATRAVSDGGGITDDLVKAAQREGTLTYYHVSSIDVTGEWTAIFTKRFGVQTKNVRGPGYPTWDKWLNESRVGRHICDVIQVTDPSVIEPANKDGFVAHYTPEAGPKILADMKADGVWYAIHANIMGIGWNTRKTSAAEQDSIFAQGWDALGDPRWKARYGTTTPASGGSDYVFWYMFMVALKDRYGDSWLQKIAANKPDVFISKPPMFDRLAAGEYSIIDQASQDGLTSLYLKGAPVRWTYPNPVPCNLTAQVVSANAPHPNAARLFQEWALSEEGQRGWFGMTSVLPSRPDVVDPRREAKKDWYSEAWYREPETLYLDYLHEPGFGDPAKPVIPRWNKIIGYQEGTGR